MGNLTHTVSGDIASFKSAARVPVTSCKFGFKPKQDLHGYNKPWPAGGGRNLLQVTATSQTVGGVTFTVNDDGSVKVVGTPTVSVWLNLGNVTLPEGNYKVQGGISVTAYINVPSKVNSYGGAANFTIAEGGETITPRLYITENHEVNGTFYPMIKVESDNNAAWEPYSNICPIEGWTECEGVHSGKNLFDLNRTVGEPSSTVSSNTEKRMFNTDEFILGLSSTNHYFRSRITYYSYTNGVLKFISPVNSSYGVGFPIFLKPGTYYLSE